MELVKYKIIKGWYNTITEEEISAPKDEKFLYRKGDIGDTCHTTHNHYMMILPENQYSKEDIDLIVREDNFLRYEKFCDLHILIWTDIRFISDYPVFDDYKEAMDKYNLNDYYIVHRKKDRFEDNIYDKIRSGDFTIEDIECMIIPGKVYRVGRVLKLEGPFALSTFDVTNGNYFDDRPTYMMQILEGMRLSDRCPQDFSYGEEIITVTKDPTEFNRIKNEVLSQIDNFR